MRNSNVNYNKLHQPEVDAGSSLVDVGGPDGTDPTFAEEYADESRVVLLRPISDRETERVRVVLRRVTELQVPVHRDLTGKCQCCRGL